MKDLNTQLMTESLKKIVQTCGTDVFKNTARFCSAIEDFLPGFEYKGERNILNMCVQVGISEQLLLAKSEPTNDGKLRIKNKAVQMLTEDYSLANERAELVVKCFVEALGIDFNILAEGSIIIRSRVPKCVAPVFFIVDTSESNKTCGGLFVTEFVAESIEALIQLLGTINAVYDDREFQFAILTFGGKVNWVTGNHRLVRPEEYCWRELSIGGSASLATAFYELDIKLSKHGILPKNSGVFSPILILFNGSSTLHSRDELEKNLNKLKKNGYYKASTKIAIGYGNSVDDDIMLQFVDGLSGYYLNLNNEEPTSDWIGRKLQFNYIDDDRCAEHPVWTDNITYDSYDSDGEWW